MSPWQRLTPSILRLPKQQSIGKSQLLTSSLKLRSGTIFNQGIFRGGGRVYRTCLQALKAVGEPAPTAN